MADQSSSERIVEAPVRIGILRDALPKTMRFLEDIHDAVVKTDSRVLVDLSRCEHISRSGCLLLTAEMERCAKLAGRTVYGHFPASSAVCRTLEAFGFFKHLRIVSPRIKEPTVRGNEDVLLVRSGGRSDVQDRLSEIADVTRRLFDDAEYADEVEIALQEAMTNVISHAYDGPNASDKARLPHRWWFAGVADHSERELFFYALDHGVGIPTRGPQTMASTIDAYWDDKADAPAVRRDKHILEAVVRARREGVEPERRGNGLPQMIGLVERSSVAGALHIISGKGGYRFTKTASHPLGAEVSETCYGFQKSFAGTLVVWRLSGPLKQSQR